MKKETLNLTLVLSSLLFLGNNQNSVGAVYTGVSGGDWATATNWDTGAYPTTTDAI